jgi:acyl-CoA thioesterase-1
MMRRDFIVLATLAIVGMAYAGTGRQERLRQRFRHPGGGRLAQRRVRSARGTGWVTLLEQRLAQEKIPATVVNASVSGDTTAGGRARLAALLKLHQPTHVVLELGGNDALRGLPLANTQDNLDWMTGRRRRQARACCWWACRCHPTMVPTMGAAYSCLRP